MEGVAHFRPFPPGLRGEAQSVDQVAVHDKGVVGASPQQFELGILSIPVLVADKGVVVKIPGQSAAVFQGVYRRCRAQGETEQHQADCRILGRFTSMIFHGVLFRNKCLLPSWG